LCHSVMFKLSKGHLQGVRLTHFHNIINKICARCKIQFRKQGVCMYVTQLIKLNFIWQIFC